jgi:hypothetical protein
MENPSAEELTELLSWAEFLEPLSEEEQGSLARRLSCSNLEAGETFLVNPEEHDKRMVLVLRGQLQVYESDPSWRELTLAVLEGGASVGATGQRLPPGYRLDTSDAASWVLRRPDGTAAARFGVWAASKEGIERVARNDHKRRVSLLRRRTS